jgi:LPS-assembly lipoprotein
LIDSSDLAPTAGAATLVASYNVTDVESGGVVASGTREVTASYDVPRQSFAALRSARDAENRAARELAQAIQLAVAQQMAGN